MHSFCSHSLKALLKLNFVLVSVKFAKFYLHASHASFANIHLCVSKSLMFANPSVLYVSIR